MEIVVTVLISSASDRLPLIDNDKQAKCETRQLVKWINKLHRQDLKQGLAFADLTSQSHLDPTASFLI